MSAPSVILMGSKPGAAVALSILLDRGWDVRSVVVCPQHTTPWTPSPSLAQAAAERGLPVIEQRQLTPDDRADFVISCMYRRRVTKSTLGLADRAAVNFHPAPLPEFGGWAFYNVAILEERSEYGCTCHHMDEGFDSGPLVKVRRFPMDPHRETALSLERRTQLEMIALFEEFCDMAESGLPLPSTPQNAQCMRYMEREAFEGMKQIPAGADDATIQRIARAFWYPPYPGAWIMHGNTRVQVAPDEAMAEVASALHRDDFAALNAARRTALAASS
jgi:methionyl-tRNA formyltransferase